MIKLRAEINKILKSIHPRVFHIDSKNKNGFPYLVYSLGQSYYEDNLEIFNLDIDVWDSPSDDDTTEIETLANTVWKELDSYYCIGEDFQMSIYRQARLTIEDDDPRIKRRTLIFNLRYYDRGN